jgi:hypothetical protein
MTHNYEACIRELVVEIRDYTIHREVDSRVSMVVIKASSDDEAKAKFLHFAYDVRGIWTLYGPGMVELMKLSS